MMKRLVYLKSSLAGALCLLAAGCATDAPSPYGPGYSGYAYYDPYWGPYYNSLYWPDYSAYSYDAFFCSPFCGGFYGGFYGYYPGAYYPGHYHGGHYGYPGPGWPHPPWHGGGPPYRSPGHFGGAGGHPAMHSHSFGRSRGR